MSSPGLFESDCGFWRRDPITPSRNGQARPTPVVLERLEVNLEHVDTRSDETKLARAD